PYTPKLIPLRDGWCSRWMLTVGSEMDPDEPYVGWHAIHADARTGEIELFETTLNAAEATNFAMALLQAVDHVRHYGDVVAAVLDNEDSHVRSDLGEDAPIEAHQAVHGWIRTAKNRAYEARDKAVRRIAGEGTDAQ